MEMLRDRGYNITQEKIDESKEQFIEAYNQDKKINFIAKRDIVSSIDQDSANGAP